MVTLRCTQKLLRRLSEPPTEDPLKPTTLLGDWYANILFSKSQQLVLCISERTLLPVVIPAKDIHTLPDRFAVAVREVLTSLGVATRLVDQELAQMHGIRFGRTNNKCILGTLNDFMFHLDYDLHADPTESLLQRLLRLGQMPCSPIGFQFPIDATVELFSSRSDIAHAIH